MAGKARDVWYLQVKYLPGMLLIWLLEPTKKNRELAWQSWERLCRRRCCIGSEHLVHCYVARNSGRGGQEGLRVCAKGLGKKHMDFALGVGEAIKRISFNLSFTQNCIWTSRHFSCRLLVSFCCWSCFSLLHTQCLYVFLYPVLSFLLPNFCHKQHMAHWSDEFQAKAQLPLPPGTQFKEPSGDQSQLLRDSDIKECHFEDLGAALGHYFWVRPL